MEDIFIHVLFSSNLARNPEFGIQIIAGLLRAFIILWNVPKKKVGEIIPCFFLSRSGATLNGCFLLDVEISWARVDKLCGNSIYCAE